MKRIYTRLTTVIFIYLCGSLFYGCDLINPKEPIPTYIHIDSVQLVSNPALANAPKTAQITGVVVYYNNNPVGSFDLPVTVPVVTNSETGTGKLQVAPIIKINGFNDLLAQYGFYQLDTFTFAVQPGKIINHKPKTSFYNDVTVTTISDFEGSSNFLIWSGNISLLRVDDPAIVFAGYGSGSITLTNVGDSSVDSSSNTFAIPVGQPAYIEFDYKSDVPFYVGLSANLSNIISSSPVFGAGIAPSSRWQKFYYNVSEFAGQAQGTSYNFYIKAVLPPGQAGGRFLIDNIQLVTF